VLGEVEETIYVVDDEDDEAVRVRSHSYQDIPQVLTTADGQKEQRNAFRQRRFGGSHLAAGAIRGWTGAQDNGTGQCKSMVNENNTMMWYGLDR